MKERPKIANAGAQTVKPVSQKKAAGKTKAKTGKDLRSGK